MILTVRDLVAYRGRVRVLSGLELAVGQGEIVGILGRNGAGKSTLLGVLVGLFERAGGEVYFDGTHLKSVTPEQAVRQGIALVPEHRQIFPDLTVEENLKLGAYTRPDRRAALAGVSDVYDLFPMLQEKRRHHAGSLSGGQQQMLAIGRALMSGPRLLLLDEPSLGLAPVMVSEIARALSNLRNRGTTMLLVEQNIRLIMDVSDRIGIMDQGRLAVQSREEFGQRPDLVERYFGIASAG